jgi:hypothetical protein
VNLVPPSDPLAVFCALVVFHALADFPLQGDYLARKKVKSAANDASEWMVALGAHSLIHAGAVWLVTGSKLLGLAELILHASIDHSKGRGCFGLVTDQLLHLACKAAYSGLVYYWWLR